MWQEHSIQSYSGIPGHYFQLPGTTVTYTETKTHIFGHTCTCIDLPGTYSLSSMEPAELEARKHLLSGQVDVVINVADTSLLCRSLKPLPSSSWSWIFPWSFV